MKALVLATLYVCLSNGQCEQKQIRLEHKYCGMSSTAEVPVNSEWHQGRVGVKC